MGGRGELGPSTGRGVRCGGQGGGSRRGTRLRTVLPKPLRATRWTPARRSVTTHGVQPRFGVRVAQRTRSGAEEEMPELRVLRASTVARSCFSARPCARVRTRTRAHTCMRGRTRAVCACARTRCTVWERGGDVSAAAPRSAHVTQAGPAPVSGVAAPHVAARFPSLAGRPGGRAQTAASGRSGRSAFRLRYLLALCLANHSNVRSQETPTLGPNSARAGWLSLEPHSERRVDAEAGHKPARVVLTA